MQKLFLDIETTDLNINTCQILQLALHLEEEDGTVVLSKSKLYNPGKTPISKEASDTHGIKDSDVADAIYFREDAKKLKKLFENKILVGYNLVKFDLPVIKAHFDRTGVELDLSTSKIVDCLLIEKKLNSNKLTDAYRRYTGTELVDAHSALADVIATKAVFEGQVNKIETIDEYKGKDDIIYELSGTLNMIESSGKLKLDKEGFLIFNFGKHTGKRIIDELAYSSWILNNDFSQEIKKLIREEQTKGLTKRNKTEHIKEAEQKDGYVPLFEVAPF